MFDGLGSTTIAEGKAALTRLIEELSTHSQERNEAQTRFDIIDALFRDCFGWKKEQIKVEVHQDRCYTDYELGRPRQLIVEAKREGLTFELPADSSGNPVSDLASVLALGGEACNAVRQAQQYCSSRGVQFAVATNGRQIIAFLSVRSDGIPPLDGKCLVFRCLQHLENYFPLAWQHLSPEAVAERRLAHLLTTGMERGVPNKLSTHLSLYPRFRQRNDLQSTLRTIAELLIEDVVTNPEIEPTFYKECYCESGALSSYALISRQILKARYASLFNPTEEQPAVVPVKPSRDEATITPQVMAEALAQRPIVLIGDVGVGKTAFLKHLRYISAFAEFKKALYVYIDLGSQGALSTDLRKFFVSEVERQLYSQYGVDIDQENFVRGVYDLDIKRFRKGLYGRLYEEDRKEYELRLLAFLETRVHDREEHLKRAVQHLAEGRKNQIIIMIDNADQRSFEMQQTAFVVAQSLAKEWVAVVFLSVRPETFHRSKRSGVLAAYPHKVFTIAPPRIDLVVARRLKFALQMAEGTVPVETLQNVKLQVRNLALFLRMLIYSLEVNDELIEIIENITGGNVRALMELVIGFIGNPNVDTRKIIKIAEETGGYIIAVHEFSKAALLGDYTHYHAESSLAVNVFDVSAPDRKEHFLSPMILAYLAWDATDKDKDGFVRVEDVVNEMQAWGFTSEQSKAALERILEKRAIEVAKGAVEHTFEKLDTIADDLPVRMTTIGGYHLKRWLPTFAYLDAMAFDTPIFDDGVLEEMLPKAESFAIEHRYERAVRFRSYLSATWHESSLSPPYFVWSQFVKRSERDFSRVARVVDRSA